MSESGWMNIDGDGDKNQIKRIFLKQLLDFSESNFGSNVAYRSRLRVMGNMQENKQQRWAGTNKPNTTKHVHVKPGV